MQPTSSDERPSGDQRPPGTAGAAPEAQVLSAAELAEHEWIRRAQRGDEAAFAQLYTGHERRAWRVARNLVPSDEDARDLVQEAFLRVFRHLERFDFRHAFSTWLYRIVTNLAIDHLRRRRPMQSTHSAEEGEPDVALPDPQAPAPWERIESEETAGEVRACLESLAPHFQSALVLRELEGLACTEIAEIVGATHVTVRWRLHRGRKLFLEEWERRRRVADGRGTRRTNSAPSGGVGEDEGESWTGVDALDEDR